MKSEKTILGSVVLFLLVFAIFGTIGESASAEKDAAPPQRPGPNASRSEIEKWEHEYKLWVRSRGDIKRVSGPDTAGQVISVAGKAVQLPSDVYVDQFVISVRCKPKVPCPQAPIYILRRGPSTLALEAATGRVVDRRTDPGHDEQDFDFLKSVLEEVR